MINIVRVYDKQVPGTHREYCGRAGKGQLGLLGNPFAANVDHSNRNRVCDQFEMYFKESMMILGVNKLQIRVNELIEIAKTQDIELACFCAPKRCHTETIKAYIEQQLMKIHTNETKEIIMCFNKLGNIGKAYATQLMSKVAQESFKQQSTLSVYFGTCTYNYSGAVQAIQEFPLYLQHLAEDLEADLNLPLGYFNMLLVNKYESGKGLGRHRDNEPEITKLSSIVSISLGASRVFSITKGYRTPFLDLELNHGDIVVMSGRSQIDYYHAVLPGEGVRYNLTFRHNSYAPKRASEYDVKPVIDDMNQNQIGIIRPVVNQMNCIPSFRNELTFLSNMYECEVYSQQFPIVFKSAETAYQAMKDLKRMDEFVDLNGYEAKRLGKQVQLSSNWNEVKLSIMEKILRAKFQGELLQKLLAVKGEIVERNNWGDSYWGVFNGKGENHLGKLLMKIRDEAIETDIEFYTPGIDDCIYDPAPTMYPELFEESVKQQIPSMTYSGIGSRETPIGTQVQMYDLASELESLGFKLYSGAADGADKAFSDGCTNKVEFIPWKGFNNCSTGIVAVSNEAMELAAILHPAWNKLSQGAKKLMARNCHQILGEDLNSPVDFVLCWTPDGAETKTSYNTGGTGQAIRLANRYGIPVINMFNTDWKQRLDVLLEDIHILTQANQIGLSTY